VPLTIRRIHAQVAPPWICISSNAPARELVDTIVAEMRRPSPNRRTVADWVRTLIELINASTSVASVGAAVTGPLRNLVGG
jgi:hypothetical protein